MMLRILGLGLSGVLRGVGVFYTYSVNDGGAVSPEEVQQFVVD